jgi:hypothetical protein
MKRLFVRSALATYLAGALLGSAILIMLLIQCAHVAETMRAPFGAPIWPTQ